MNNDYEYVERAELRQRMNSGANWFFWIAVLSFITSIISISGGRWAFFLSLGITQVIDGIFNAVFEEIGTAGSVIAIVLDIFITAIFAAFGFLARAKQLWAFIVGGVLFFLDMGILLLATDVLGILFHGFALFCIFRGFQAGRELVAKERQVATAAPAPNMTATETSAASV